MLGRSLGRRLCNAHIQVVGEGFGSISNALGLLGVVLPLDCISVESHVPDCLYGRTHTMQWNTSVCMCVCVWRRKGRGTVIIISKLQLYYLCSNYDAQKTKGLLDIRCTAPQNGRNLQIIYTNKIYSGVLLDSRYTQPSFILALHTHRTNAWE